MLCMRVENPAEAKPVLVHAVIAVCVGGGLE